MNPVVALDIDGTLGDYHGHFIRFAAAWLGRALPSAEDNTGGIPFYTYLHMSKQNYRDCKLAYRQGGLKRSMPCYPGASDLTRHIRKSGYQVWICTTRPYLRLDNIDPDTRHWLRRNGIQYDGVIYGPGKYRDLGKQVDEVALVVDDLPELVPQALGVAGVVALRDQPYNRYWYGEVPRVYCIDDMWKLFNAIREGRA